MASSNKPTAVHFSLIFFVMLSIILAVVAFMFRRDFTENTAKWEKTDADLREANSALVKQLNDIKAMKGVIGYEYEQVGDPNSQDANTVLGAARVQLTTLGGPLADQSYNATLTKIRQEMDTLTANRDQLQSQLEKTQQDYLALQKQYNERVDQHQTARGKAEADLQSLTTTREEALASKDKELNELRNQYNTVQVELQQAVEKYENLLKEKDTRIANLLTINQVLRDDLDNVRKISFEVEDGKLVRVDHNIGMVWINLGSADSLPPRTAFSVYDKNSHGVGRSEADVKGKIEVTRIVDAHLAEARVLNEDITRPMAPGDLVYTPLWTPGRVESFAFAGTIDLDNDGRDDRELLHQILKTSGAEVASELLPNGERTGGAIDVHTKFLVIGDIPEANAAAKDEEKERVKRLREGATEMRTEAREHGVRIINLNDFLAYIGYHSKRRLFMPGQSRPYSLKAGTQPPAVDNAIGGGITSGNVSGAYGNKARTGQQSSDGNTSKIFRGGTKTAP